MGEPVIAVPERSVVLLRRGEEAPDLRIPPEDVVHLHGCRKRLFAARVLVMSILVFFVHAGISKAGADPRVRDHHSLPIHDRRVRTPVQPLHPRRLDPLVLLMVGRRCHRSVMGAAVKEQSPDTANTQKEGDGSKRTVRTMNHARLPKRGSVAQHQSHRDQVRKNYYRLS